MPLKCWHQLLDFCFAPLPPERLRLWQRVFALSFLYFTVNWGFYAQEWLTDYGFHISAKATNTVFPAPYPLIPRDWLIPFLVLLYGSTLLTVLDFGGRTLKFVMLGLAMYLQFADQVSSFTLNKLYILGFGLFAFASAPKKVLVKGEGGPTFQLRQSAWPVRIMQATLIIQYTDAGICKVFHGDWATHFDILYGHSVGLYRTEAAAFLIHNMPRAFWIGSSMFALLFEIGAPIWFMIPKLRPWGLLAGIGMHVVIAVLMKDLIFFSFQMITFYVLFLPEERVVKIERQVHAFIQGCIQKLYKPKAAPAG